MSAKNAECVLANQDQKRAAECAAPANKKTSCLQSPKPKKTLGASDADVVAAASYSQRPLF